MLTHPTFLHEEVGDDSAEVMLSMFFNLVYVYINRIIVLFVTTVVPLVVDGESASIMIKRE